MAMRRSRALHQLRSGNIVSSFKVNLDSARLVEAVAAAGFDCIWTDMEHTANDWSLLEKQIWAAKAHDADVLVRIPRGSYSDYSRALEMDASGLIVPHVMSLEDARHIVHMTRFHPLGRRALDGGNADGVYGQLPLATYLQQANSERLLALQIEDPEVLPDLEAIAALDGVDMLFFGPGDFSHALGVPGDFSDPRLVAARKRVAEVCARHGKWAATVGSPANFAELAEMGYRFINMASDVSILNARFEHILSCYREWPK